MALFKKVFGKKKTLTGDEIIGLFKVITVDREPVIISTATFKVVTDIISHEPNLFHLKNTLTRDEVLYQLKGQNIKVHFPYELTLFGGLTSLMGLGLVQGVHTLKFRIPESLTQVENRGAYRISSFPETPVVTFTSNHVDLIKAHLSDISMTGAGIRLDPRWLLTEVKLSTRTTIIVDIKLTDHLRISCTASVRYFENNKLGIQFSDLSKGSKDRLFKLIVQQRREEQRAMMRVHDRIHSMEAPAGEVKPVPIPTLEKSGKPCALVVGADEELQEFLTGILGRKFDLLYAAPQFADIRQQCHLSPNLCLIELPVDSAEMVSQMKKAASILPQGCVLMYYGENFTADFRERFLGNAGSNNMLIDLQSRNKLMLFKEIEKYYKQKAPR